MPINMLKTRSFQSKIYGDFPFYTFFFFMQSIDLDILFRYGKEIEKKYN